MFKENTFYKAKKNLSLTIKVSPYEDVQAFKDEMLFIVSVEWNKTTDLYVIDLIKDFKLYKTFWTKENIKRLVEEIT